MEQQAIHGAPLVDSVAHPAAPRSLSAQARPLDEGGALSQGSELPARPLKLFSVNGTTAILDANGNEVVGWMGFDDSNRTKAEHRALAARIVQCVNAHDELLSIAERWLALDASAWHAERHAHEKAELMADTRAAIERATS